MKKYLIVGITILCLICYLTIVNVEATKTILNPFTKKRQKISNTFSDLSAIVTTTLTTINITLTNLQYKIFCDTDNGAISVTLPPGINGTVYVLYNTGSSRNTLTITPDAAELLFGENSNYIVSDGGVEVLTYEITEGWR